MVPKWFQPCQCCCRLCYPREYSSLEPSSDTTEPRYLSFMTVSSYCPFTLISLLMPLVLFVINLVFSALISMPQAELILPVLLPLLLRTRCHQQSGDWWLFCLQVSVMILSRNMSKRVDESRHSCRTPTVVRNQSPMLPLKRTALVALSKRCLMARISLALMLYFFMVAHKAACQTLSKPSWSLRRRGRSRAGAGDIFTEDSSVEDLFYGAPFCSEACLFFGNFFSAYGFNLFSMIFSINLLGWLMRLIVR